MTTVWSHNALDDIPRRWRALYRILFPVLDFSFVVFGIASFIVGSKIVEDFIPGLRPAWAIVILAGAGISLWAGIFQRKRTEFFANLALMIGLLIYGIATVAYIFGGNDSSILTLIFVEARLAATMWRMWDLTEDIGKEEADREIIAVRTGGTPKL